MERIDLDQKLEYKGYWYLPTAPEDRVAGVLTYHPNEKIILLKFRKCYAASLNLTFRFISLTMSSSSSMMALRTSGA